ncbi:hypothetical protein [Spirosoma validum]|uniref:Uncharacterized protein n=1 Tax=Spirosoma validum TaxID=2771355 RepID=A0A927AXB1_9BACT|nr:hypothetical protein [Spirosoma validum]MBD2751422.1 hypothetical protein [Spirosoma validum]
MKVLLYVLSLLTVVACSGNEKSTQNKAADSINTSVNTATRPVDALPDKPTPQNGAVAGSNAWHYEKKVDKEGRTVYKASIISPTLLEFDFPYNGGSTATMTIRKRETDTHVYIQVSKGQFNRSFQEGKARVRFDGGPPMTYAFLAAENGSANIVFFNSEQTLINKMKAARNMVVDVEFAGQGKRQITFKTTGLKWNH